MRLAWSPYPPVPSRPEFSVADGLALFSVGLLGLARWYPFDAHPLVVCTFKRFTGIPCLTCGMTRSWVHLSHLRVEQAVEQSPLGALLCALAVLLPLLVAARHLMRLPWPVVEHRPVERWVLGALAVALVLANWWYTWRAGVA